MRTLHRILALAVVIACAGCDNADAPPRPLAPTPVAQPQPPTPPQSSTPRLNGRVTDTAFRALANARVEVLNGPHAGSAISSNATGEFSFLLEHVSETTRVRAEKEGYTAATRTPLKCPTCPNYNVGFQLALPVAPATMSPSTSRKARDRGWSKRLGRTPISRLAVSARRLSHRVPLPLRRRSPERSTTVSLPRRSAHTSFARLPWPGPGARRQTTNCF